jgi:hypothetical protein
MTLHPLERARSMVAEAREDKRLSAFHRRRARERMEAVRKFCAEHGIAVTQIGMTEANEGHGRDEHGAD